MPFDLIAARDFAKFKKLPKLIVGSHWVIYAHEGLIYNLLFTVHSAVYLLIDMSLLAV